jgi:hypothetical protein
LDCGFKSVSVLLGNNPLGNNPLAKFSPTFFGFASQGVTSKLATPLHYSRELISIISVSDTSDRLISKQRPANKNHTCILGSNCAAKSIPDPKVALRQLLG